MADYLALAQQMRDQRNKEQLERSSQAQTGGAALTSGGVIGQNASGRPSTFETQTQPQAQGNPLQQGLDAYSKYKDASNLFKAAPGSSLGATGTAYAGSGLGGTGYGLGGSLVAGGSSGASTGGGLGSMLGAYSGSGAASSPASFGALGSTTQGGLGGLLGGSGAASGGTVGAGSSAGAGAGAGGAMGGGAMAGGGMLAGLAALGLVADKEMNENKGSMINADKLNDAGTIGGSGIGIRFGDFGNAFNPATWLSDPKKAGKSIVNAFTLGFLDKFM